MTQIFNRGDETAKRRQLRAEMPPAERALWKQLRGEKLGCKFRRQTSVGAYVVDFYCARLKLAIEVDGESHVGDEAVEYDAKRQGEIEALGVEFLRFSNQQVYRELEGVVETIRARVAELLVEREEAESLDEEEIATLTPSVLRTSPPS